MRQVPVLGVPVLGMLREVLMAAIYAPFTAGQRERLNRWQRDPDRTPFTCPQDGSVLIAKLQWECTRCSYRRDWAPDYAARAGSR